MSLSQRQPSSLAAIVDRKSFPQRSTTSHVGIRHSNNRHWQTTSDRSRKSSIFAFAEQSRMATVGTDMTANTALHSGIKIEAAPKRAAVQKPPLIRRLSCLEGNISTSVSP
jgi:hypothetical protein